MKYLKKLNWSGALIVFALCIMAAMARKQDPDILTSFIVGLIIGVPVSILFLFMGKKD
jgi:hypothetical protein